MNLIDLLDSEYIEMDLESRNKFEVIESLLDVAARSGRVQDRAQALKDLIEREQYLSTGFENGLAVPHAKTEAVSDMALAFGFSREGVEFDSLDDKPAHFIFLLLSPMDTSGPHIQTLALLARNFQDPQTVERLQKAVDKEELIQIINDFK